jgi:uncharacterized protein YtpQ (UPF0354 family)
MRRRMLVGLTALAPVRAALGQPTDMRSFRTQVLTILRQKYPQLRAKRGKEDSLIEIEDGAIDLTNLHGKVRQLPADQQQAATIDYVDRLLERVGKADDAKRASWVEMSKLLRPRLVAPEIRRIAPTMLLQAFATGALTAYVLDHGRQVEYLQRDMLNPWGVDSQRVHEAAVANLEALSQDVEIELHEARDGGRFTAITTDDSYDAARLVLPRFRARLLGTLGEPIFAGVPNRDFLVAWSADASFAAFADRVAKDFGEQPYPITDTIFRVDRQGVRPATAEKSGKR